jgi:ribosome-associated protein
LKLLTPRAYLRPCFGFAGPNLRKPATRKKPAKRKSAKRKPAKRKPGAKGLATLSQVEISRAERRVPEAVSRMRADAEEILRLVLHRLDDMKAEDTLTINLRDRSSIGDYMVVSSGRSHRHVGSVADRVIEDLRKVGVYAQVEGMPHCDWVLIDAGDVIVHVFRPEVRDFYNLEKMWMVGRSARRAS